MSTGDDGPGRREVAYRLFAAEFDDATLSYAESDEERAPKYVVTPTGARLNRTFAVGVLTEVESVNDDVLRSRVVDPTGAFVSYAGQYQPDAAAFFERTEPPAFVALTGKARTFQPEDSDRVYTSVRPESVSTVDAGTRDRWTVSAAEATLRRVVAMADARSIDARGETLEAALLDRGYDESLAAGIPVALDHYGTTVAYLDAVREMALDALEIVTGERAEVRALDVAPDDAGTTSLGPLPEAVRRSTDAAPGSTARSAAAADEPADAEPTVASTVDDGADDLDDGLGEFDDGGVDDLDEELRDLDEELDDLDGEEDDVGGRGTDDLDEDGELYELDEAERREVEAEFDVGFESGAEVDDPGEADIDVPGPDDLADEAVGTGSGDAAAGADTDEAAAVDLEDAVVDAMSTLDDGDGAPRDEVVAAVIEDHGADPGAVTDAIEDALMSGKCYEPSEDRLKAI
jgi:RPA family protein